MARYRVVGVDFPNRRRDRRNAIPPIQLELDGEVYTTVDWSLGGFLIAPYRGRARPGMQFPVVIVIRIGDRVYRHRAEAEVVRAPAVRKQVAARFTRLEPDAVDTMEGLITGRLRRLQRRAADASGDFVESH